MLNRIQMMGLKSCRSFLSFLSLRLQFQKRFLIHRVGDRRKRNLLLEQILNHPVIDFSK